MSEFFHFASNVTVIALFLMDAAAVIYYFENLYGFWTACSKKKKTALLLILLMTSLVQVLGWVVLIVCVFAAGGRKNSLRKKLSAVCILSLAFCWARIFFEIHYFYVTDLPTTVLYLVVYHGGFWLLTYGISRFRVTDTGHSILNRRTFCLLAAIPIFGLLWCFYVMFYWTGNMTDSMIARTNQFYHFPMCALMIIFDVVICYLYYMLENRQMELSLINRREEQVRTQLDQYEKMKEMHRQILAVQHDIGNHLSSIQQLLATGQYEEAQALLQGVTHRFANVRFSAFTGIPAIDSILNLEYAKTELYGIAFEVNAAVPSDLRMNPERITTILGNLLDNAIEACKNQTGEPKIALHMSYVNCALMIQVKNTAVLSGKGVAEGTLDAKAMETTKADKTHHGFGLHNVREAAEQMGGSMEIHAEDAWFYVRVILYNQTDTNVDAVQ